ncbi:MAG: recombination regulator RecX [Burkholderiales bacterium]|nr:recombination regulator RecX [Burkholderiales bacterium]
MREHSRTELLRKLAPHAQDEGEITQVLDTLEALGYLSAERFVDSVVHRKAARFGMARIKGELAQHHLPDDAVRQALATLQGTELERAQALWQRRYGQVSASPVDKAKQMRFLAGRGFSGDVIRRVVRGSGIEDD